MKKFAKLSAALLLCGAAAIIPSTAGAAGPGPTKGTEILWDKYGVPHIFAPDRASQFYAYGYAQMTAHAELLIRLYTQSRGEAAQYYGEPYLEFDKWVRENSIPELGKQWSTQQSPEFAPLLAAFTDGLNAYIAEHRSELSPEAQAAVSRPYTTADVLGHGLRVIHFDWIVNEAKVEARIKRAGYEVHGSNEWAIAPSHSANGHAMLMSNSHLAWSDVHTYMEVQLSAPGITSYGAVWVGIPVLRQNFTDFVGWTQTTNDPDGASLYKLTLKNGGYVLDGQVKQFDVKKEIIKVKGADGKMRDEPFTIKSTVQGPVVFDKPDMTVAMRVADLDRPRWFEQFYRMSLAHNFSEWQEAFKMQQLPLFNTAYADRDGHIAYIYNASMPVRTQGDYAFWGGVIPGDDSKLIWDSKNIVSYDQLPKSIDPPIGWVQNSNDPPWTNTIPELDPKNYPSYLATPVGITTRAQRGIRTLNVDHKMTFDDIKNGKLSTHMETGDQYRDDLVAAARKYGTDRAKQAADVLAAWDKSADNDSDGTLMFYRFMLGAGTNFTNIGGYVTPFEEQRPEETPRGFADPAKAAALLDKVAADLQAQYGTLHIKWGDVARIRRGNTDMPGNGAPSMLGAIRTMDLSPFKDGKAEGISGDTFYAIVEFSSPIHAESLLGYGNWSKAGSKHVDDQVPLYSRKEMKPVWKDRQTIEANLDFRKTW